MYLGKFTYPFTRDGFSVRLSETVPTTTNNVYMLVFEHQASMDEKQPNSKGVKEHLVNRAEETSIFPSMRSLKRTVPPTSTTSPLDESSTRPKTSMKLNLSPKPHSISYIPRQIPMHMPLSFLISGA